jgi:hypothetical protein
MARAFSAATHAPRDGEHGDAAVLDLDTAVPVELLLVLREAPRVPEARRLD